MSGAATASLSPARSTPARDRLQLPLLSALLPRRLRLPDLRGRTAAAGSRLPDRRQSSVADRLCDDRLGAAGDGLSGESRSAKQSVLTGVIRAADYLINSEAETLLPDSQQRLARGDNILIFPEGTRTRYGEALELQRGAANIAVRAGCDLRVVHITCSQRMLDKQSRWYQIPPVKPLFTVRVQARIDSQSFCESNQDAQPLAARRLTRHLQQTLVPLNR
ncbi:1-acyl-sn-glycerol-3-phosphate acyltransferase [Pantoea sp. Eser]|nr:1-acyl-sn-glycerol-3-phosphate acyltransferase [Pantoea sp. Eser]